MWENFVLYVRSCENCPSVPVLYLYVPSDVVKFFSRRPVGWTFEEWVREKLEKLGIRIPESVEIFVQHPALTRLHRDVLIALPEVFLQ